MTSPLVSTTDHPFQLLPPLTVEQRDLLRQSIKENGVLEPVVFDEDGEILDGHHRVEIAEELGIEYPRRVIDDLDRPGKHMYALTVNVARRQLDQNARGGLVAQMRIRGMSIREIAKATGLPKTTVARDLAQVSQMGHLPEKVTGSDGKEYAPSRPTPDSVPPTQTPEPVAAEAPAPVAGSGSASPEPEPEPERRLNVVPEPATSEAAEQLRADLLRESERRTAIASIRSVLTYLTSRVLSPEQVAQQYVIALGEYSAEELRFAAKTMAALAALKEQ